MSSAVPSFLSWPKLVTTVSSSSQTILNGSSQASVSFEALSTALSLRRSSSDGHRSLACVARHVSAARRSSIALVFVVLICASVNFGNTATATPPAMRPRMTTTIMTSMSVTPRVSSRRSKRIRAFMELSPGNCPVFILCVLTIELIETISSVAHVIVIRRGRARPASRPGRRSTLRTPWGRDDQGRSHAAGGPRRPRKPRARSR